MAGSDIRTPATCIAIIGATLAILTSGALNLGFAIELGAAHSKMLAAVFAAGALAATLLAASMPACVLSAFEQRQFARSAAAFILWLAAIAFSVIAAVGAASIARSNLADGRLAEASATSRATAEHIRLSNELATIAPARARAELAPLASVMNTKLGDPVSACRRPSMTAAVLCDQVADLKAEAARADRRERLAADLRAVSVQLDRAGTARTIDPQSAAVASYLAALGMGVEADRIAPWLSLGTALFFELASALGLVAAGVGQTAHSGRCVSPALELPEQPIPATTMPEVQRTAERPPQPAAKPVVDRSGNNDDELPPGGRIRGLTALIKANGGHMEGGQRDIARRLGLSKSRAHELLHELAAAGLARLTTGRTGTRVELINA